MRLTWAVPAVLLTCQACEPGEPEPSPGEWPPGAVLAVDGLPILAEEVDVVARAIGELYPAHTQPHLRRLALTNVVLPRAATRTRYTTARQEALVRCRAARARLAEGAAELAEVEGDWRELGLDLWSTVRDREPGRWSEPIELIGRWALVRLDEVRTDAAGREILALTQLEFSYPDPLDAVGAVDAAIDAARLTIIDAAWAETVPEMWQRRMAGGSR